MNLEKLKPWNWFKHEEHTSEQIPITKNQAQANTQQGNDQPPSTFLQTSGPIAQLHEEMMRLFDNTWRSMGLTTPATNQHNTSLQSPFLGDFRASLDVCGNENEYEISIDVPGLEQKDIQLEIDENRLTIRGEKEEKTESKEKHYYCMERCYGAFQRTLALPNDANSDDITAVIKNGVLDIRIPRKALPSKDVKRIAISS